MRGYNILPKVKLRWLAALMRGNISLSRKTIYIKTAQQGDAPETSAIKTLRRAQSLRSFRRG